MMTPLSNEFTPEELAQLSKAVPALQRSYRGLAPDEVMDLLEALQTKIRRLLLIGKRVKFLDIDDKEQVGELRGYLDWEDLMMAEIACKGFIHRVGLSKVLGEA